MDKTAKPPRALLQKKRWLWLLLPLLLWVFCEVYDHVPKRSWFYRQTHTIALIDVTAKLEIDGQPLTLTRTLRCIRQPPVRGLARNWAAPDSMTVFDAVGGVTSTGRTFILNVPKACEAIFFNDKNEAFATMLNNEHLAGAPRAHGSLEPVSYQAGDLAIPIVYEPVGKYIPDHINVYAAFNSLINGDHGVKFVDLVISQSSRLVELFDHSDSDWLGGYGVATPKLYEGYLLIELPSTFLISSPEMRKLIGTCVVPCTLPVPELFQSNAYKIGFPLYFNGNDIADQDYLRNTSLQSQANNTAKLYATDYVDGIFHFIPDSQGMMILRRLSPDHRNYDNKLGSHIKFSIDGDAVEINETSVWYVSRDRRVFYLVKDAFGVFVGR